MRKIFVLAATLFTIATVFAQNYTGMFFLNAPLTSSDAKSFGAGGLTVLPSYSASNAFFAPNRLTEKDGFFATATFGGQSFYETRQTPLFDSFDERVGWMTYVDNRDFYENFSAFVGYKPKGEWIPAFAAGITPVFDSRYNYEEQIRNDDGTLLGTWTIESNGVLMAPVIAVSENILKYASVGVSAAFLSGKPQTKRSVPMGTNPVTVSEKWESALYDSEFSEYEVSATVLTLALSGKPFDNLELGLRYTLETDFSENTPLPDKLPSRLGVGFSFMPGGYEPTHVTFEAELVAWESVAETDTLFAACEDVWNFRIGVEHKLPADVPVRFGAFQQSLPVENIVETGLTAGSGFAINKNVSFDFAVGYVFSKSSHHDLFPESWHAGSNENLENSHNVRESSLIGNISATVEF